VKKKKKQTIQPVPAKITIPTYTYTRRVMAREITQAVKKLVRLIAKREPHFRGARKCTVVNVRIELERTYGTKKKPKHDRASIITDHRQVREAIWWKAKMNPKSPKKITNMIL